MIFSRVERGASALDEFALPCGLVCAIDVQRQFAPQFIEVQQRNSGAAQPCTGAFGTRDRAPQPCRHSPRCQQFDQLVDRGAGTDAQDDVVMQVGERRLRRVLFFEIAVSFMGPASGAANR